MRLSELEPCFMKSWVEQHTPDEWYEGVKSPDGIHRYRKEVQLIAEADCIDFLCPVCFTKNNGPIGTHLVMVSFAGCDIPDGCGSVDSTGKPSRWNIIGGSTFEDLSLNPSILLSGNGCGWHGYITAGEVTCC